MAQAPADDDAAEPRSRRDRPAKPPLSRAVIVDAALALVERDGLEAATLRNVAQRLDTGPASLYVYVANRDELLERMLDRVLAQIELGAPAPDRWREALIELFTDTLEALDRFPGLAQVALGAVPTWPAALAITERALALLRAGGIPDQAAAWTTDALYLYTAAISVEHAIERRRAPTTPQQKAPGTDFSSAARAVYAGLPPEHYPNLTSMAVALTTGDASQRFRFGLTALIDGARTA